MSESEDERAERRELERLRLLVLAAQRDGARRFGERLREPRLSPSQAEILGVLAQDGPLSLADLGRRIVCESGSPSRAVDLLVNRGLVSRSPSSRDRRFVDLDITDEGRALLPQLGAAATALDDLLRARLDTEERTTLARLLTRLLEDTEGLDAIALRCGPLAPTESDAWAS